MSSTEEIAYVYLRDISVKSKAVRNRVGILPFLGENGAHGFSTFDLYGGIISPEDMELLRRIK